MTHVPHDPALADMAAEAEAELQSARALEASPGEGISALYVAEIGYYEAELTSLRDAATTLEESD
jgi:hypothetical protein